MPNGHIGLQFGHYIVDPGRKSHPGAAAVHGYSDWLLRSQEPFDEIAKTVGELIADADLIAAHNAEFDVGFINRELATHDLPAIGKPIFCTMQRYRALGFDGSASLDAVARRIRLGRSGVRHGALEDAWLAMMIYLWLNDCPYRMPFSAFPDPRPSNLVEPPPQPEGRLPRRKRVPSLKLTTLQAGDGQPR